jgi:hypothetical protein
MADESTDWHALWESATSGLRESRFVRAVLGEPGKKIYEPPYVFRELQFLMWPHHMNPRAFDIVRRINGPKDAEGEFFLAITSWNFDIDHKAFIDAYQAVAGKGEFPNVGERLALPGRYGPTVEVKTVPISKAVVEKLLKRYRSTKIPIFAEQTQNIDHGTQFELCLGGISVGADVENGVRYCWDTFMPERWRGLGKIVKEMRKLFETLEEQATTDSYAVTHGQAP